MELIDEKTEVKDRTDAKAVKSFEKNIVFNQVNFSYTKDKEILQNIDLTIEKGKVVALVGPSGGGKSTLVDLIPRFMDVTGGQILFDGTDLRDLKQDSLRDMIGVVNQESILFNDTIFNNIAFANLSASQEEVEAAARIANAHEFILKTEHEYQTNIGDRGGKLSHGLF